MKRLLVNLDDEVYEALRTLAFEKNTQMAKLVLDRTGAIVHPHRPTLVRHGIRP